MGRASYDAKIWNLVNRRQIEDLGLLGRSKVVGAETIQILLYDSSGKILLCTGLVKPTDATAGYAKGAIFLKTNAAGGTSGFYTNKGTTASCAFGLETAATVPGDITLTTDSIIVGVAGVGADTPMAAQSVVIKAAGAVTDTVIAEARVLGRATGGNLGAVQITNEQIDNAAGIAVTKLATLAADTVMANATSGVAPPTAVVIAENRVLGRLTAGTLGAIQITGNEIDPNASIGLTQLEVQAANTVLANATAGVAVPTAIAIGTDEFPGRADANIVSITVAESRVVGRITGAHLAGIQILNAHIDNAALIALSKLATQAAATFVLNATAAGAVPTAVALAVKKTWYTKADGTVNQLALARGDLLTADANVLKNISISAGSVVVSATGPDIAGVALAAATLLVGTGVTTPKGVTIAAGAVVCGITGPDIGGVALTTYQLLKGVTGVTPAAQTMIRGDILIGAAADIGVLSAKTVNKIVCGDGTDVISATVAGDVTVSIAAGTCTTAVGAGKITGAMHTILTKTVENTDNNITVTAAQLVGGYMEKTNCSGGHNVTTDTAANIQTAFNTTTGAWFDWAFANQSTQTETLVAGANVTLKGTAALATGKSVIVRFVNTGAGIMDAIIISI